MSLAAVLLAALVVATIVVELNGSAGRFRARLYARTFRRVTGQDPTDNPYEDRP